MINDKFKLIIRTPDKTIFDGTVDSIYLETDAGEVGLLADHASLASTITYTKAFIKHDTVSEEWVLKRGLIFFSNEENAATVLINFAEEISETDIVNVEEYLKLLEERLDSDEEVSHFEYKYLENEKLAIIKQLSSV